VMPEGADVNAEIHRVLQNPSHVIMSDSLSDVLSDESMKEFQEDFNSSRGFYSELVFDENFCLFAQCLRFSKNDGVTSLVLLVPNDQLTNFFNSKLINEVEVFDSGECIFSYGLDIAKSFNFCVNFSDDSDHCEIELSF